MHPFPHKKHGKSIFDVESPGHNVEANDLVRDNTVPLIELDNLDKGCLAAMARRINITLR